MQEVGNRHSLANAKDNEYVQRIVYCAAQQLTQHRICVGSLCLGLLQRVREVGRGRYESYPTSTSLLTCSRSS